MHHKQQTTTSAKIQRRREEVRAGVCLVSVSRVELLMMHAGRVADNPKWCAFFTDCVHEVLPVKSGYRVSLTYNVYRLPKLPKPKTAFLADVRSLVDQAKHATDTAQQL